MGKVLYLGSVIMNRIIQLLHKLCSIKGLFAILFTVLLFLDKVDPFMTYGAWILFIGSREGRKAYIDIIKLKLGGKIE